MCDKEDIKKLAEKYDFIFVEGHKFKVDKNWYICYQYYMNLNYDYLTDTLFSTFIAIENLGKEIIVRMYNVTDLETETIHYKTIKKIDLIKMEKHLQKNLKKLKELKSEIKIKEIDKDFE